MSPRPCSMSPLCPQCPYVPTDVCPSPPNAPPRPQVLDRLLLYLRIVHSVDYYNTSEYVNEDEMPNRCGIVHVRGPLPPNRVSHGEGRSQGSPPWPPHPNPGSQGEVLAGVAGSPNIGFLPLNPRVFPPQTPASP